MKPVNAAKAPTAPEIAPNGVVGVGFFNSSGTLAAAAVKAAEAEAVAEAVSGKRGVVKVFPTSTEAALAVATSLAASSSSSLSSSPSETRSTTPASCNVGGKVRTKCLSSRALPAASAAAAESSSSSSSAS
jgi:hypothetical protein